MKNNQTAFGSSCFIIYKLDLSGKVDQLFTIIIAYMIKNFLNHFDLVRLRSPQVAQCKHFDFAQYRQN